MGRDEASPSGLYGAGERGAGGKFKKPAIRRPPATPYDRPPANQSLTAVERRDGGWLSKFVNPACRLIADGATRILPSFFPKSPFTVVSNAEDHDNGATEVKEIAYGENEGCNLNLGISESSEEKNLWKEADNLKGSSDFDQLGHVKRSYLPHGIEFSKIEQLVKGRSFSRAEIDRLTEILNSRVTDLCNIEPEENKPNMASKREGDEAVLAHENSRTREEKYEETSMPLLQSVAKEEVSASPVDIARAYMGIRLSEVGTDFKRIISKDERALLQKDRFASKPLFSSPSPNRFTSTPLFSSPSPKSSVCWPGAIVQDQYGGSTPQNGSSRYGLRSFPRTPYSRIIYSKSKSKADKNRYLNIPSSPHWQPETPVYGQDEILCDGNGSVGPIRHFGQKFPSEAPPRASIPCHFPQNVASQAGNCKDSKGFLPSIKKNLEAGATTTTTEFNSVDNMKNSSEVGFPTFLTPNSAVRAILDHLDTNKSTPKEKSAELKLATLWKKSLSSEADNAMLNDCTSLQHLEESNFTKCSNFVGKKSFAQGNSTGNKNFQLIPQASTHEVTDAVNKDTETSGSANGFHDSRKFKHEMASFRFPDSRQKAINELPNSAAFQSLKKPQFYPSGTKPILSSISVDKPDLSQTVLSDNSFGFTFPVSTSSVLSEPPTPSVMPSTSTGDLPQPKVGPTIPSYSFGTTRSTPALVFSFPSMSTASLQDDVSDLKFSFRSNEKNMISFRSVGKDAICF